MSTDSYRTLMQRSQEFAALFEDGNLAIRPRLATIILTCVDARVDPAYIFGLQLGDALVIRNTGGRINRGVVENLGVLRTVAAPAPGATPRQTELVVLQHTDCGMSRLLEPEIQVLVAERLGISQKAAASMAISDPADSVRGDIEWLRHQKEVPDELIVSGLVYDVTTADINEVAAPGALRA